MAQCHRGDIRKKNDSANLIATDRASGAYACAGTAHGPDLETQLRELREHATSRGWDAVEEYIDRGSSGPKVARPSLARLMGDARRGAFDTVLVWNLNRFGRSLRHLIQAMAKLNALGVALVSLRDGLEVSPDSRPYARIVGALADFETTRMRERVKVGLRKAQSEGRVGGRRRVTIDKAKVLAMRESGASWRKIAKGLGVGLGTAYRAVGQRSKNVCA
jgi:DNA invertase Pin-like site-specific DNA recombinase